MDNDESRLAYLVNCYLSNHCSEAERKELSQLLLLLDNETVSQAIEQSWNHFVSAEKLNEADSDEILKTILEKNRMVATKKRQIKIYRLVAAVAAIFLLFISLRYTLRSFSGTLAPSANRTVLSHTKHDIAPGKGGAVLTLADGSQILIDSQSNKNEVLARQNGVNVLLKKGKIIYTQQGKSLLAKAVGLNTMSTPRGRTFKLQLPDGTNVWLNAESSISFPVQFNINKREVKISGEAYFEVAKLYQKNTKERVPFIVHIQPTDEKSELATVEVLGTHFNINAYSGLKGIKTTLLEGSVKVWAKDAADFAQIKPGMQAKIKESPFNKIEIKNVDVEDAIAWKNGLFNFNNADLKEVMQELSRWYDVDVVYNGDIPNRHFWGKMQKSLYLSQVLLALQKVNVNFKIDGNKIIVSK
ncbi:FecR family protein [Arachidicoccus sp.]|jgi:ferric-dicitrate binding protein FerR (iron transport regulator)|uniref:FecR family protein n=1 Tax=Arachidicoccus sp. TaxID=1872624 RepID=UPI003D208A89